jgi:NAD(P)-dependent dehydrogenase (short-subunit alcohol dehydrogenase family)
MQIKDRVFIVTGASSGIGLSTAIVLSERGAKVALLARSTIHCKSWRGNFRTACLSPWT